MKAYLLNTFIIIMIVAVSHGITIVINKSGFFIDSKTILSLLVYSFLLGGIATWLQKHGWW